MRYLLRMLPILFVTLACSGRREPVTPTPASEPAPAAVPAAEPIREPGDTPPRDLVVVTRPLCADGEHVHFSCALLKARVVSLCGSESLSGPDAALRLRVGLNLSAPDVVWPPGAARSVESFEGARGDGVIAVRTGTGRTSHEVFIDGEGGGYTVVAPNGTRTEQRCLGAPTGDLGGVVDVVPQAESWR